MGFFESLHNFASRANVVLANQMLKKYKNGETDSQIALNALKTLASDGKLYRYTNRDRNELWSYYWETTNSEYAQNIRGERIRLSEINRNNSRFVKVKSFECDDIDFSLR